MENQDNKLKLFFGGNKDQHIGWVEVYNGVNVIEYTVDRIEIYSSRPLVILPNGDILIGECFGAFDLSRHKLPY